MPNAEHTTGHHFSKLHGQDDPGPRQGRSHSWRLTRRQIKGSPSQVKLTLGPHQSCPVPHNPLWIKAGLLGLLFGCQGLALPCLAAALPSDCCHPSYPRETTLPVCMLRPGPGWDINSTKGLACPDQYHHRASAWGGSSPKGPGILPERHRSRHPSQVCASCHRGTTPDIHHSKRRALYWLVATVQLVKTEWDSTGEAKGEGRSLEEGKGGLPGHKPMATSSQYRHPWVHPHFLRSWLIIFPTHREHRRALGDLPSQTPGPKHLQLQEDSGAE